MSYNNSLHRGSYQPAQNSPLNSSSDFPNPVGTHLANVFRPSNYYTKPEMPLSARYYLPHQSIAKPEETFIPYISERDKMNRLISRPAKNGMQKSASGHDLMSFMTTGKTRDTMATTVQTPKEKKRHLTCLLYLDPNFTVSDSASRVVTETPAQLPENESQAEQCPLIRFKLNIPKTQRVNLAPKIIQSKSGHNSAREKKHSVAFLKIKRNEPLHLRTQSSIEHPSVGHYDTKNVDLLRPRLKNIIISKRELDRNKAMPQAREPSCYNTNSSVERTRPGCDFTKQTNRANKCIETEQKEAAKVKEARIETEVLTNNKSLFTKTKIPKGIVANTILPYELKLMREVSAHLMKQYKIANTREEDTRSNRAKKIKNIDPRTIEEAWVKHFA